MEYLNVPGVDIQNVSLSGRPRKSETRYNTAKGEGRLAIGQPHHIYWHLYVHTQIYMIFEFYNKEPQKVVKST